MGKSTPSAPPAPDPNAIVKQQQNSNTFTAIANQRLNNVNQVTPYGNLTYKETGGGYDSNNTWVPQFTATQTMSPEMERLFKSQMGVSQGTSDLANSYVDRIKQATAQPFSYDGMPAAPTAPKYDANFRQHTYDTMLQRAQPQQEADQRALAQRLADQGVGLNDPGYQSAMRAYNSGLNDFRLGADLQSQQEASQDFNTQGQAYGYQADARTRAIQEALQKRNQPINEVSALLGTGPGVQMPQFVNTPQTQIAPTDVGGIHNAAYQGGLQQYGMQQQANNATTGGLFGLGGSLIMGGAFL